VGESLCGIVSDDGVCRNICVYILPRFRKIFLEEFINVNHLLSQTFALLKL
jgi:hypothetical protein